MKIKARTKFVRQITYRREFNTWSKYSLEVNMHHVRDFPFSLPSFYSFLLNTVKASYSHFMGVHRAETFVACKSQQMHTFHQEYLSVFLHSAWSKFKMQCQVSAANPICGPGENSGADKGTSYLTNTVGTHNPPSVPTFAH